MSKFSKEKLYEIYGKYLPIFTEIANEAIKYGVDITLKCDDEGTIRFDSKEWKTIDGEWKLLREHFISQGKKSVSEGSETYKYDN